jgi:hypothetical protein
MSKKTRSQSKKLYRVRNWSDYDAALVKRGSLTVWISEGAIAKWKPEKEPNKRGLYLSPKTRPRAKVIKG